VAVSYNTTPRRRFSREQRFEFLRHHQFICYWCGRTISPAQPWDIEHLIPRELMSGKEADDDGNLRPIHSHPETCHKEKSKKDKADIAKSNRIRREHGPAEQRKKTKHPIRSKGFAPGHRSIPSRPFPKRLK
jgi:hypothetical protein